MNVYWKEYLGLILQVEGDFPNHDLQQDINHKTNFPTVFACISFDFFIEEWCKFQEV
jgi:hypothetical protein